MVEHKVGILTKVRKKSRGKRNRHEQERVRSKSKKKEKQQKIISSPKHYKARGFLSSVNKLAMGTLSRGAELHVPALGRPTEGTGMGSIYGKRSGAEMALTLFKGLKCLASVLMGEAYEKGEGFSAGLCMMLPSGEASGVGGRTPLAPVRQISSSWAAETSAP